jgi:hypothetical protein
VFGSNPLTLIRTAHSFWGDPFKSKLHVVCRKAKNDFIAFRVVHGAGNIDAVMSDRGGGTRAAATRSRSPNTR